MEKRILLAVSLSFLILFVYQSLFVKPTNKARGAKPAATTSVTPQGAAPAPVPGAASPPASGADVAGGPTAELAPGAGALVADREEREVVVETDEVRDATFQPGGLHRRLR